MIARVLAMHPSICTFHELHPHLSFEAFVKWRTPRHKKWVENRIRHKRSNIIKQIMANNMIYVESSHYTSLLIEELYNLYNAKFVHLYRDGRYFVRSALEKGWHKQEPLKYRIKTLVRRRWLIDTGRERVDQRLAPPRKLKTRFEKLAWLWSETNEHILRYLSSIPDESKFSIRVEDFNKDMLIDLQNFIGVSSGPETINEMLAIANRKPNKSKDFASPLSEDWSGWQKQRFNEIAGEMMHKLGYSIPDNR